MPVETVYALGASNITVSDGEQLSGISQGDGSHLVGHTITLNSSSWETVQIDDNEGIFADNDGSQRLEGNQTFDGTTYNENTRVETEFRIELEDADGNTYTAYAFNINEAGVQSYSTVEGLVFEGGEGGFPPIGVPLTVVSAHEGPSVAYDNLATALCFTENSLIDTPVGPRAIGALRVGDLVNTLSNGPQEIRWIGVTRYSKSALDENEKLRPIRIVAGALGSGLPVRDLLLSRQHRVLVNSPLVPRMMNSKAVLVPAQALCVLPGIDVADVVDGVTYYHLMLDQHDVVFADGAPAETLYFGSEVLQTLSLEALDEIYTIFPELEGANAPVAPVLPMLSGQQSKSVLERHRSNAKPLLEGF